MSNSNTTLGSFDSTDSSDDDSTGNKIERPDVGTSIGRRATAKSAPDRSDLPMWGPEQDEYGLTTRRLIKPSSTKGRALTLDTHEFRWVTDGDIRGYCEEYGQKRVQIPNAYSSFDAFDTHISTATTLSGQFGYGFDAARLEVALRLLTGGGRYQRKQYKLLICEDRPAVLTGPEGTVLVTEGPIERPDTSTLTPSTVEPAKTQHKEQFTVHEENTAVLNGIERLISAAIEEAEDFDGFEEVRNTGEGSIQLGAKQSHKTWSTDGTALATIGTAARRPTDLEIPMSGEVTAPTGDTVVLDWTPEYSPDDTVGENPVVGYQWKWHNPQQTDELYCVVETILLHESYTGYKTRTIEQPVATVRTDAH